MVCIGSLVKLKYKTMCTSFDRLEGLRDTWIEMDYPGIVVSTSNFLPIPMCDISFDGTIFYGVKCEDLKVLEANK